MTRLQKDLSLFVWPVAGSKLDGFVLAFALLNCPIQHLGLIYIQNKKVTRIGTVRDDFKYIYTWLSCNEN